MASTSEELTAQASHLQETIAFFKVETKGGFESLKRLRSLPASTGPAGRKTSGSKGHAARGVKLALPPTAGESDFERY
jgi:hypothetical protein